MNFDAVRSTVDDVIPAMWDTSPRGRLLVREGWPAASCENVAVAVAAILEDRGFGQWTFVVSSRPGEDNSHAWLEWRDSTGNVVFSIDPTLHQLDRW